jgi:hypothetical protein
MLGEFGEKGAGPGIDAACHFMDGLRILPVQTGPLLMRLSDEGGGLFRGLLCAINRRFTHACERAHHRRNALLVVMTLTCVLLVTSAGRSLGRPPRCFISTVSAPNLSCSRMRLGRADRAHTGWSAAGLGRGQKVRSPLGAE